MEDSKSWDTKTDIKEGLNPEIWSVGVVIGSSQMGLSYQEFEKLSERERNEAIIEVEQAFNDEGADFTIKTMKELPELIQNINVIIAQGKNKYNLI